MYVLAILNVYKENPLLGDYWVIFIDL
ncbi:uncharacterized protein METZ01_LOCUS330398 [marine metagenome]|uniref:Uncharacterized protein n=1 Tax=marine metagenome TaxID=408172 RepID=A0A382PW38_9ZZZZ